METAVCIPSGVRPEWMFSVVTACQRLAGDTFGATRHGFTDAVTRFQEALPAPACPIELMVLRDRIIENTTKAAELFDWCFHCRFAISPCGRETIHRARDAWSAERQDLRGLLPKWSDVFLTEFDRSHRRPLAERVAEVLRDRYAHAVTIDCLSREFGCARTRMTREFRTHFGMSISMYLTRARVQHGLRTLRTATYSVDAVARAVGYRSPKNFYAALHSLTGLSPSGVRALSDRDFDVVLGSVLPRHSGEMSRIDCGASN
jgi:AraC-like DNA-binding protein